MRRPTRTHLVRTLTLAVVAAGVLVACNGNGNGNGPLGPDGLPGQGESVPATTVPADTSSDVIVDMLLWDTPLASDITVSKKIGSGGGTLELKGASTIRLIVPKGAVPTYTIFTITRRAGRVVSYDFGPHGATFAVPVRIEHETRGTNFPGLPTDAVIQAIYFADDTLLDQVAGTAVATELLETGLTATKDKILFSTGHFSGYGVSTGRRPSQ